MENNVEFGDEQKDGARGHKFRLQERFQTKLKEDLPEVLDFITSLQKCIQHQQKKIKKLKHKLKRVVATVHVGIQTDEKTQSPKSVADDIKEAAEIAMQKSGFAYEETSGMYYHYESGYYYNAEMGLYYDGNKGTYMRYNDETQTYEFHSQAEVVPNPSSETHNHIKMQNKRKIKAQDKAKGCKKERSETVNDMEEGECSDSSESDDLEIIEIAKGWPPCMRIIIKSSSIPEVKEGSLHIVTMEGGSLGREGQHSILIPDINISKHHLNFKFDQAEGKYSVLDMGSRNGTFLNGKRLSVSKQESSEHEVAHGSQITVGGVVLLCHIHSGNETCGHCEPGLIQQPSIEKEFIPSKKLQHKIELKNLKKKFGIETYVQPKLQLADGYTDRADDRRKTIGSHNEHEKTEVASVEQSISTENKGYKLLSKMGWSENQSLGKDGTGIKNPIEMNSTVGNAGIGFRGFPVQKNLAKEKSSMWETIQKRYEAINSSDMFQDSD